MIRRIFWVLLAVMILIPTQQISYAQKEITINITERQIRKSFEVENEGTFTSIGVSEYRFQNGNVLLRGMTTDHTDIPVVFTMGVSINNGQLVWQIVSATASGKALTPNEAIDFLNKHTRSWLFIEEVGRVTSAFTNRYGLSLRFTKAKIVGKTLILTFIVQDALPTPSQSRFVNCIVTTTTNLSLRYTPAADGDLLIVVPPDTKLRMMDRQGGWVRVTHALVPGWVNAHYLKLNGKPLLDVKDQCQ